MKKESFIKVFKSRKFWWFVLACVFSLMFVLFGPGVSFYNAMPFQNVWVQVLVVVFIFACWLWFNFKERLKQHVQGSKIFADEIVSQVPLGGFVNRRRGRLIRRDFRRLCQFIRGREVHRSWFLRRNNIYDAPWYLVLGAVGSGKTSLVRQCHLNFIAQSYQQERVQSGAFDYAVASDAVLLDVNSELFLQKTLAERYLWLVFLKSIKRVRARRPLNGIILTLSLKDLLGATREVKQKLFENFRMRLHEAQQRLGMEVPIYVVFTQLDYVVGFTDFVLQFLELERQAVLGMTFSRQQDPVHEWMLEYDLLLEHLQRRLERDLDADSGALINSRKTYFLVQMAALKPLLAEFAKEVFVARGMLCKNQWRGVYFVAHQIQADQSFDILSSERSLNMVELPRFLKDKNFFAANILSEALLPERELVGVHPIFSKSFGLFSQLRFLLLSGVGLLVLGAWCVSANEYVNYDRELLWQLNQQNAVALKSQDQSLNAVYQRLDALASLREAADSPWLHLGLWVHHSGVDAVGDLYDQALLQDFLPYVVNSLAQNLQGALRENPNDMTSVEDLYYGLSSYLMLQNVEHLDATQMAQVLNTYWSKSFANQLPVQAWLSARLMDLLNLSIPAQNLNAGLISQARALLWNSPVYMQAYLRLKLTALQNNAKTQNVSGDLNADANEVFVNLSNASVPQLFTHAGYENIYKAQADHYLQDTASESWVFGQQYQAHYSSSDLDNFRAQMDVLYWQDYLNAWNSALAQVNLASFSDLQSELDVLNLLSSKNSPLTALLKNIDKNTDFDNEAVSEGARLFGQNKLAGTAANFSNANNGVSNQFAPVNSLLGAPGATTSPLATVNVALTNLQQYLSGLQNSSNPGLSAYNAAVQIYQGQADRSITAIASLASQMPQPMARWLNQIVANTYAVVFAQANAYLSSQWQAQVASFYQQALAGRYPFVANSNDATVQDFANFFKPGGIEDSFVKKYLAPFISTDNFGHVTWQSVDNIPFSSNAALSDEITSAGQIRSTFFGGSNGMLNFTLTPVSLTNLHKFTLTYDGKTLSDDGHGSGVGFVWPPMNTDGSVSVTFGRLLETDQTQNYSGPWGLFRLLEHSNLVKSHSASSYNVSFVDEDMAANFILSASSVSNPFDVRVIRGYRCPEQF